MLAFIGQALPCSVKQKHLNTTFWNSTKNTYIPLDKENAALIDYISV
jgi:hypothetical protein